MDEIVFIEQAKLTLILTICYIIQLIGTIPNTH